MTAAWSLTPSRATAISDAVQFRQAGRTRWAFALAEDRLDRILIDEIRAVLGSEGVTSNDDPVARPCLADELRIRNERGLPRPASLGLDVVDVRLKQHRPARTEPGGDV